MNPEISVGSLATAKYDHVMCMAGEVGVCYEVLKINDRPFYCFIFENGGHDDFSPIDVKVHLDVSLGVSQEVAGYQFKNNDQLQADYRAGRSEGAFNEGNELASTPCWPQAPDSFKNEWNRNLTHPRDEALEKLGEDIEADIMDRLRERDREPDLDR